MSEGGMKGVDDILSGYNIARTGEDIRRELYEAGYVIVPKEYMSTEMGPISDEEMQKIFVDEFEKNNRFVEELKR